MVLPGDEAQVEACLNTFADSANLNAILAQKSFSMHSMVLLGDEAQVEARFGPFGDSANLDAR
jgi:hypothetical protein